MRVAFVGRPRWFQTVQVVDKNESTARDLQVRVAQEPDALIFREHVYKSVRAWICGECGHVDLFVPNPQKLYEAYLISLTNEMQVGGTG